MITEASAVGYLSTIPLRYGYRAKNGRWYKFNIQKHLDIRFSLDPEEVERQLWKICLLTQQLGLKLVILQFLPERVEKVLQGKLRDKMEARRRRDPTFPPIFSAKYIDSTRTRLDTLHRRII